MSNDKKTRVRNRDKRFTLRVSQEEKETLLAAMAATGSTSVVDLVMNAVNNSNVILINEVESYNDVFAKAGSFGKNINKGLNFIQRNPEKFKVFIDYLEKDNGKNFAAMMTFASNLEKAVNAFCIYEENIKCSAELTLKEFVKSKKKKGA
jgi:dihydroorotase-like cyclic amidohydrolase